MGQTTADEYPSAAAPSADEAASTLRDVAAAGARARVQARNVPGWFGPVYAAVIAACFFAARAAADAHSPWVLIPAALMLLTAYTLIRARRRSTGVKIFLFPAFGQGRRMRQFIALLQFLAAVAVADLCWTLAAGSYTADLAGTAVVFFGLWALSVGRSAAARRQLRERV
ncbi:hypothetical protein [Streptomyces sp. NBC_00388]|uniref:hypothetical protein n=1 Tax=Streptomyces sp. NBC_00388 TaxID=2975735 RepID=UPI002E1E1980